jgi:hypothetical protein
MVGADAPEIIQGLAVALKCGVTKKLPTPSPLPETFLLLFDF